MDGCRALTCLPFRQGPLSGLAAVWASGRSARGQQDWAIVAALERSMGLAAPRVREPEEIRLDLQYCPAVEDPAIESGQN